MSENEVLIFLMLLLIFSRNSTTLAYPILKQLHKEKAQYGTTSSADDDQSCSSISDGEEEQIRYPFAVIFVLISKTFEAFAANGVRSKWNLVIKLLIILIFL